MDYEIRKAFDGNLGESDKLTMQEGSTGSGWKLAGVVEMEQKSSICESEFTASSTLTAGLAGLVGCTINGTVESAIATRFLGGSLNGKAKLTSCTVERATIGSKSHIEARGDVQDRGYFIDCDFKAGAAVKADSDIVFVRCKFSNHAMLDIDEDAKPVFVDCDGWEDAVECHKENGSYW